MPSISSGKVLVTGANGFIAAWVVHDLLEHGFSVRGSVRSDGKATYLRDHFGTYGDKFEVTIVKDMTMVRGYGHKSGGPLLDTHMSTCVGRSVRRGCSWRRRDRAHRHPGNP